MLIPSLTWGNHERENKWDAEIGDFVPIENKCSYDDNKEDYFNYLIEIHSCDAQTGFPSASDHYVRYTDFFEVLSSHFKKPLNVYMGMTPKEVPNASLVYHLKEALSGGPDIAKMIDERYLILSGCRHQSCTEKALIWIDTKDKKIVSVIQSYFFNDSGFIEDGALTVFTNDYQTRDELPNDFKYSLHEFILYRNEVVIFPLKITSPPSSSSVRRWIINPVEGSLFKTSQNPGGPPLFKSLSP